MSIIFGPVFSRRFGKSLGVDLSPETKQCNFDCLYCELASTQTTDAQSSVVPVEAVVLAIQEALAQHPDVDVLTLTANGEPTLYPHLDELLERINALKGDIKTLILSNGSTITDPHIRHTLQKIDIVKLSLDCATPRCFKRIDRSHAGIDIAQIQEGMLLFREQTPHPLIIEILLVQGINDSYEEIAALDAYLMRLRPDQIDLGTIDRPPAYDVRPVSYARMVELARRFDTRLPIHITGRQHATAAPEAYDESAILATLAKRPLTREDIEILMDTQSQARLQTLIERGQIEITDNNGVEFFTLSHPHH